MARDKRKYVYYTIGFLRGGVTHQSIQADAEELDAQEPTVAKFRLEEYYRLRRMGQLYGGVAIEEVIQQDNPSHPVSDLKANASEAAEAWPE